jgi:predicted Zn-dependent protease
MQAIRRVLLALALAGGVAQVSVADESVPHVLRYRQAAAWHTGESPNAMAARFSVVTEVEPTGEDYRRALELYEQGPSAADAILAALAEEMKKFPDAISAPVLQAKVLKGTNRCHDALAVLRALNERLNGREIVPMAELLEAECLYYTGKRDEARKIIVSKRVMLDTTPELREKLLWLEGKLGVSPSVGGTPSPPAKSD